jgi:hypothetical protein
MATEFMKSLARRQLTVRLIVFFHENERVVVDVAEVLDVGPAAASRLLDQSKTALISLLNTPIVSVLLHQFVAIEEPRVESTHVPIREASWMFISTVINGQSPGLRTSINDVCRLQLLPFPQSPLFVDPIRLIPVVARDKTKLDLGIGHHTDPP